MIVTSHCDYLPESPGLGNYRVPGAALARGPGAGLPRPLSHAAPAPTAESPVTGEPAGGAGPRPGP